MNKSKKSKGIKVKTEDIKNEKISSACCLFLLVSCLAYFSTLKTEVIYSSVTPEFLRTAERYKPKDRYVQC
jgi:hypothetical protein